ncbi:MAG: hypothetical protein IPO81_00515 [Kouleothrix sp.]|nr:hypothetical protein [Kouleothrix sp.]
MTRRQGDKETRRQGDKETRRQGDTLILVLGPWSLVLGPWSILSHREVRYGDTLRPGAGGDGAQEG